MIWLLTGVNKIVHKVTRLFRRTHAATSLIRGSGVQEEVSWFCHFSH
jgi:hypothetical protein